MTRPRPCDYESAGGTAVLAPPRLAAFLDGDRRDDERSRRVEPPEAKERIAEQTEEDRGGEVGAQKVLRALAARRGRAELVGEPALCDAEERHSDHARGYEDDAEPTSFRLVGGDERVDRFEGDVGREQEELDGD